MMRWPALFRLLLLSAVAAGAISPALAAQTLPRPASSLLQSAIMQVAAPDAATPSEDLKLTLPDGAATTLRASLVIRIRKALPSESARGAKTHIDWLDTLLVRESPGAVATAIGAALPSLGKLLMPDGSPIWFNVMAAYGPMHLSADKMQNGILSGMILGGKVQYLASAPEQVRDEITARGGSPLPMPGLSVGASTAPLPVWDADIPQ